MDIRTRRPGRSAVSLGLGVALLAATGVAAATPAVSALASQASAARPATAARPAAASAPTSVRGTVIRTIGAASASGQGAVTSPNCDTTNPLETVCEIWARPGSVTVNDGAATPATINVWKFAASATEAGGASAPLVGTTGVKMTINVHNDLGVAQMPLSLSIPQLDGSAGVFRNSDGSPITVAPGAMGTFSFTPDRAGTYAYQAGLVDRVVTATDVDGNVTASTPDGSRGVAMGLVGGLIVRPANPAASAYDTAEDSADDEALLVYTDVDTNLAANPSSFNMRDYNPRFHLINGVAYPDTTSVFSGPNRNVLLRVVNGSILEKSPTLLGARMNVFARGSRPLAAPSLVSGRFVATGDTFDATVATGTANTRYALYDAPGHLASGTTLAAGSVNAPALGGGVTFIQVGGIPGVTPKGPVVTGVSAVDQPGSATAVLPAPLGRKLTFTATFDGTFDQQPTLSAQYFIDSLASTPKALTGFTSGLQETLSWDLLATDFAGMSSGMHTMYVRGTNSLATGGFQVIKFRVDNTGPAVSALVVSDPAANGTLDVDVSATLDERTTGGSNATAARAWIDGAAADGAGALVGPITLDVNGPRLVAAASGLFTAAQIAGLPQGPHTVYLQGQDEFGQWGTAATTPLVADRTAPVTTAITLTPQATNGLVGSPNKPGYVTIVATVTDSASAVTGVQGYLDTVKPAASANGLYFSPLGGGKWTTDMPLSWLAGKKVDGPVTVLVVGTDAAGNRADGTAPSVTASLLIDRTKPGVSITNLAQGTGYIAERTVAFDATVSDGGSGVVYAEWFVGGDPGQGRGTAITVPGAPTTTAVTTHLTYDLWARGIYNPTNLSFTVRTKDAAGNWSQVTKGLRTESLNLFVNGFEAGQVPALRGPRLAPGQQPTTWTSVGGSPAFTTTRGVRLAGGRSLYVPVRPAAWYGIDLGAVAGQQLTTMHASFLLGTRPGAQQVVTGCFSGTGANCQPNGVTVFQALNAGGNEVISVQYGRATATSRVMFRIGTRQTTGGLVYGAWTTRNPAANTYTVTVDWASTASNRGAAILHINGGRTLTSKTGAIGTSVAVVKVGSIYSQSGSSRGSFAFDSVTVA